MVEYVELHAHSYFSLLDGTASPETLVTRAAEMGMSALALTDHNAAYGAVELAIAAQKAGIQPIFGAELTLASGHHLTLLVKNQTGWQNLCWLITQAQHHAPKGEAALPPELLEGHTSGLVALSGCRQSSITTALANQDTETALQMGQYYCDLFGKDDFWIELQHHFLPTDSRLNAQLVKLANTLQVGYVATNNVHYPIQAHHRVQDVLVCIKNKVPLHQCSHLRPNSEYYLKSTDEMRLLFADYPDAVANTMHIAVQCIFKLRYGLQVLPQYPTEQGMSAINALKNLCEQGLVRHELSASHRVQDQLNYELTVIEQAGLANYFLIVWDIIRFAHERGIRCQGRGSAANSLVAYLIGISVINPLEHDLVFERFLSYERQVVPDIDVDFDGVRREEVIQYVYERYGANHAAMACTFITFHNRSAVRDVAKVLDVPPEIVDEAVAYIVKPQAKKALSATETIARQIYELVEQLHGLPRHLGIHNGGMVVTGAAISNYLPTEPARMQERRVVQWDKDSLENVGLIKIDILGLKMLSLLSEAVRLLPDEAQRAFEHLHFDDPSVFEMISDADTVGVFQVESRAQAQMLPRFRPTCFADIIIAISLIRPGAIQSNAVHPYLRRRLGQEPVSYPHPCLEQALGETLGVILFQEQVLKVAHDLAGFTPGQGEQLRRALSSKNAEQAIIDLHDEFIQGAVGNGISIEIAEEMFTRLKAFGGYSFAKSHAASFAVLVYQSAWLKRYYPKEFFIALLNNQPMGYWQPDVIVREAQRLGVMFLPVDIQQSQALCSLENGAIRLGFNYIKGIGAQHLSQIVTARATKIFANLFDFCQRTQLSRRLIEDLIMVGAMDDWGKLRRDLIWELGTLNYIENELPFIHPVEPVTFAPLSEAEKIGYDYEILSLSLRPHPLAVYRQWLDAQRILSSETSCEALVGNIVRVAGLMVVHQSPPTAKGFHFLTLEDEFGFLNVIVRPQIYPKFESLLKGTALIVVMGEIQRDGAVTNIIAIQLWSLARLYRL